MSEIVRLTSANSDLLENLAEEVFDHPVRKPYLDLFVNDPRHVMFLAVENGQVVGFGSGVEYFHPDKPPEFWVNEVGVAPAFQRRGLGKALSEALLDEAAARGCRGAWLLMEPGNGPARALYSRVKGGGAPPRQTVMFDWDFDS